MRESEPTDDKTAPTTNIWADSWEQEVDEPWFRGRERRLAAGKQLGATLYELPAGGHSVYHFHHGTEELLVILRGTPTLRTPAGERVLAEGSSLVFARGAEGAHGLRNETEKPVRYLMAATRPSPDAVEYPDTGQLSVMALTDSQTGAPLWHMIGLGPDPDA